VPGKDAGLAIAAALVSALSSRLVRAEVAVTGGLTPAGDLLPPGRLKDKLATAKRGYAQRLIAPALPPGGQPPAHHDGDPELVLAATADEALAAILARHRAKGYTPPS
jgi:predicted ATP-dependent serine protease